MSDFIDFLKGVVGAVTAIVFVVGVIAFSYAYGIIKPSCERFGELSGNEVDYALGYGCIVKYKGEWVDYSVASKKKHEITVKDK